MSSTTHTIDFNGEELVLLPEAAIWWPTTRSLILSDVHLGKSATFRASGVPVPEGENHEDLERITHLVHRHEATSLFIVGDLLHSRTLRNAGLLETLTHWIPELRCEIILVLGNHDPSANRLSGVTGLRCVDTHDLGSIMLIHDPADAPDGQPSIAGHLHPLCRIGRKRGPRIRVPCFYRTNQTLILPAFGTFTSGSVIDPGSSEELCYAIVSGRVVAVPSAMKPSSSPPDPA